MEPETAKVIEKADREQQIGASQIHLVDRRTPGVALPASGLLQQAANLGVHETHLDRYLQACRKAFQPSWLTGFHDKARRLAAPARRTLDHPAPENHPLVAGEQA